MAIAPASMSRRWRLHLSSASAGNAASAGWPVSIRHADGAATMPSRAPSARSRTAGLPGRTGQFLAPGLAAATQAIVNRSSWAIVAEGPVGADVGVLHPGGTVNVRGAGIAFNGSYYRDACDPHASNATSYVQKFEAKRNAVIMTGTEIFIQAV